MNDVTHRKCAEDLGDFEERVETRHQTRRFDFWGSLRRDEFAHYGHRARWGPDEKDSIERLCLSPYVEEPLNSKVIKRFVPELRSRYVFFVFRDPMF